MILTRDTRLCLHSRMQRILHVGIGPLGQKILGELVERQIGHVVAAVDRDPAMTGRTLAQLVPGLDPNLRVMHSLEEIEAWDEIDVAIVTTASDVPSCMETFRTLLRQGKAIVTTCEEMVYPWLRHLALAEELEELAKAHGGRILGTGVNPGFLMDALPCFASCVSRNVRSVECYRVQDASSRRIPFQKKIGAGLDDAGFAAKVKEGTLRHVGLGESLHFLSHYLGLPIERWEESIGPVHATREVVCGVGTIAAGKVAGVKQVARGYRGDEAVIYLEFQAAVGQAEPHDRIVLKGVPDVDLVIRGGVHGDIATSAIVVNSIPRVVSAVPGLHTMGSIAPPFHAAPKYGPK